MALCAAGTCTAWTVDNGILTYLFDGSGTIVRAEKREGALTATERARAKTEAALSTRLVSAKAFKAGGDEGLEAPVPGSKEAMAS